MSMTFGGFMTAQIFKRFTMSNTFTKGVLIAFTGAFLLSLDSIFVRLSGVSGFDTVFLFGLFTAISLPILMEMKEEKGYIQTIKDGGQIIFASGFLMLISATSFVLSIKNTSIANAAIIQTSIPVFATLFSWLFLKEVTRKSTWLTIIIVGAGLYIVVSGSVGSGNLIGDSLALLASAMVALNQTLLRKHKNVSRMGSIGMGGLFIAAVMFFPASPSLYGCETWIVMAVMGLFSAPIGRVLTMVSTRYLTAPEVGIILAVGSVLAPLWGYFIFNESPTRSTIAGGILILGAIITYSVSNFRKDKLVS